MGIPDSKHAHQLMIKMNCALHRSTESNINNCALSRIHCCHYTYSKLQWKYIGPIDTQEWRQYRHRKSEHWHHSQRESSMCSFISSWSVRAHSHKTLIKSMESILVTDLSGWCHRKSPLKWRKTIHLFRFHFSGFQRGWYAQLSSPNAWNIFNFSTIGKKFPS